jgi:amino acid transporter
MATDSSQPTIVQPVDTGFQRSMGLIGATWASETSIIGSGWLFGAYYATTAAGPAALIGWLIGGVAIIILALCHAELGGMFPVSGGTARFPHFAFGSTAGTAFGFFSWLQAVTVAPVECFAVFEYLSYFDHGLYNATKGVVTGAGFLLTIVLMAIFTAVNFLAMRVFTRVNEVITWWKVAIPVLAIIVLLFKFHGANFTSHGFFMAHTGIKAVFSAIPSAGIVFAYLGFEQADQLAAEVKNPQRNLPRAIIISIMIGTLIYCLLQIVFTAAMPPSALHGGWAALTHNPAINAGPFAGLAGLTAFAWLANILRVDAAISPAGTGNMYVTSTSRIGYGLGRNRYFPQAFTKLDKRGIPWVSLLVAFVLGLVFLLPFPSWHSLVTLVTLISVLMYCGAPLSMGAFRRRLPDIHRPYRMWGAPILGPVAFMIANLLVYWAGFGSILHFYICLAIGYVLIGGFMIFDKTRPPLEWRSAIWLPAWLIGLGLISWQGQFTGSQVWFSVSATHNIPFWADMGVVAAFALAIYFWAYFTAAPRADMEMLISRQSVEQENINRDPNLYQ